MVRASRDRVAGPARCPSVEWETGGGECGGTARRDKARASQVTAVAVKTIYVSKGGIGGQIIAPVHCPSQRGSRHASGDRQYVLTSKARRRSLWHQWFAWYPVVVKVDDELDHWVWFERLERKWSISKYGGKGHWTARPRSRIRRWLSTISSPPLAHQTFYRWSRGS
jgi:hypothetical protein